MLPTQNDHARECSEEPPTQNENVLSARDKQNASVSTVRDNVIEEFFNNMADDGDYAQVADVFEDLGYCKKEG